MTSHRQKRQLAQVVQGEAGDYGDRLTYYLDGAHTPESMATCAHWFADASHASNSAEKHERHVDGNLQRILVFNCQQVRQLSDADGSDRAATPPINRHRFYTPFIWLHSQLTPSYCGLPLNLVRAQERNPESLLRPLIATLKQRQMLPDHALFVVPDSSYASLAKAAVSSVRDTSWQQHLASVWQAQLFQVRRALANGNAPERICQLFHQLQKACVRIE